MEWHIDDIPWLSHHLPHALHDLMVHEDAAIVKKGISALRLNSGAEILRHRIIGASDSVSPAISVEKSLDPQAQRSAESIGLLLHDYLAQLPSFTPSALEGEKLLEHWQRILLEHPQRMGVAKQSNWHDGKAKVFWQQRLINHHRNLGIRPDAFSDAWDDWQRASGIGHDTSYLLQLPAMKQKQWQDLVIRSRLHHETSARETKEWFSIS